MNTHAQGPRAEPPTSPNALPYDRERLLARLGGSLEILTEVAELFCSDAERMLAELAGYVSHEDERAVSAAHQLKGVLLNVAADAAAATARQLEGLIRAAEWHAARLLTERLGTELRELVRAFSREASAGA